MLEVKRCTKYEVYVFNYLIAIDCPQQKLVKITLIIKENNILSVLIEISKMASLLVKPEVTGSKMYIYFKTKEILELLSSLYLQICTYIITQKLFNERIRVITLYSGIEILE